MLNILFVVASHLYFFVFGCAGSLLLCVERGAALWSQCRLLAAVAVLLPSTGCVARKLSSCGTQAYS